jgi:hypothetical protein
MSIYQEEGFNSRRDYLASLAEDFGIPESVVFSLAGLLGSSEDFDGLVTACDDYAQLNFE